jgi:hypothetical protein
MTVDEMYDFKTIHCANAGLKMRFKNSLTEKDGTECPPFVCSELICYFYIFLVAF